MTSPKKDKTKEEKKKVVVLLLAIGLIIFFFLWRFVFSTIPKTEEISMMPVKKTVPAIDFDYLEGRLFESFVEYETIPAIDIELFGRENPFNPY